MQSLTNQIYLMIKSQQPGRPPPIESGRHALGLRCIQCGQPGHTRQFCKNGQNSDKKETVVHLHKTKLVKDKFCMDRVTIGNLLLEINRIRLLICLIRWPIHNNKRGTTWGELDHKVGHRMSLGHRICIMIMIMRDKPFIHRRDCKRRIGTFRFNVGKGVHRISPIGGKLLQWIRVHLIIKMSGYEWCHGVTSWWHFSSPNGDWRGAKSMASTHQCHHL